jgi:hypothetical protein
MKVLTVEKDQIINFWKSLDDSNNIAETITKFKNKTGYDSERTLFRWAQAHDGFRKGLSLQEIAKNTEWKLKRIEKIYGWWKNEFVPIIDVSQPQGKFAEKWQCYMKIAEAIIATQFASLEQRRKLMADITRQRIYLNDEYINKELDEFAVHEIECTRLGVSVHNWFITQTIDRTSRYMNKKYKRQ